MTDSEKVAQRLHLAGLHTLIESADVQNELIPRRAEDLAKSLSKKVAPLFGLQTPIDKWKVNILKEWKNQRPLLEKIFDHALKIKTKALVSKHIFEVIFPGPGDMYDPEHVETEVHEPIKGDVERRLNPTVRICLFPGLKRIATDRKPMDYNSFRRPSDDPGVVIASPMLIPE